jgi:hypothetical protein
MKVRSSTRATSESLEAAWKEFGGSCSAVNVPAWISFSARVDHWASDPSIHTTACGVVNAATPATQSSTP